MNASSLVFVDASAWIALYHKKDQNHQSAWSIYSQLLEEGKLFLISNWVAYEAISILKSRVSYKAAKSLWDVLQDAITEIKLFHFNSLSKPSPKRVLKSLNFIRSDSFSWTIFSRKSIINLYFASVS